MSSSIDRFGAWLQQSYIMQANKAVRKVVAPDESLLNMVRATVSKFDFIARIPTEFPVLLELLSKKIEYIPSEVILSPFVAAWGMSICKESKLVAEALKMPKSFLTVIELFRTTETIGDKKFWNDTRWSKQISSACNEIQKMLDGLVLIPSNDFKLYDLAKLCSAFGEKTGLTFVSAKLVFQLKESCVIVASFFAILSHHTEMNIANNTILRAKYRNEDRLAIEDTIKQIKEKEKKGETITDKDIQELTELQLNYGNKHVERIEGKKRVKYVQKQTKTEKNGVETVKTMVKKEIVIEDKASNKRQLISALGSWHIGSIQFGYRAEEYTLTSEQRLKRKKEVLKDVKIAIQELKKEIEELESRRAALGKSSPEAQRKEKADPEDDGIGKKVGSADIEEGIYEKEIYVVGDINAKLTSLQNELEETEQKQRRLMTWNLLDADGNKKNLQNLNVKEYINSIKQILEYKASKDNDYHVKLSKFDIGKARVGWWMDISKITIVGLGFFVSRNPETDTEKALSVAQWLATEFISDTGFARVFYNAYSDTKEIRAEVKKPQTYLAP